MFTEDSPTRPLKQVNWAQLLTTVQQPPSAKLLVVGDLMLDLYTYGHAERISPEAPVPVLLAERSEVRLGGAANVAHMAKALGADVALVGLVGADPSGHELIRAMEQVGLPIDRVVVSSERPTTAKHRFVGLAGSSWHQMLRVDREECRPTSEWEHEQLWQHVEQALLERRVVVISDYAKGICAKPFLPRLLAAAQERELPVLVDPMPHGDYSIYRGATLLKPNRRQTAHVTGRTIRTIEEAARAASHLAQTLDIARIVVTLDRDGLLWYDSAGDSCGHVPAHVRDVCDITGAGDMVLAALATFVAEQVPFEIAVTLANLAAGCVVEQFGVVTVSRQELYRRLVHSVDPQGKVVTLATALQLVQQYRRQGKRIVFTNGCFDLLHAGHLASLTAARAEGDVLFVAVNSDQSVRRLKGPERPIVGEQERLAVVAALQCVDHVLLLDEDTPHRLLEALQPDVLVKGGTYRPEEVVGREVVEAYGGSIRITPVVEGLSTTALVQTVLRRSAA